MSDIKDQLMNEGLSSEDLWSKAMGMVGDQASEPSTGEVSQPEVSEAESGSGESELSLVDAFEQFKADETEGDEAESEEDILAASSSEAKSETSELSDAKQQASDSELDIEELFVKGPEGRKQKLKVDYSDRKAIKQAFVKAAGMRKFQAERDAALKSTKELRTEYEELKTDFDKIEKVFQEQGAKGIVALLGGGEDAWTQAVDAEMEHRDYVSNLSAEEKYKLEMQKRDEMYQKQLGEERNKREQFQQQMQEKEEQAALRDLESKLHPAFDRYRFAGKLGDESVENLYDEAIWEKVKQRLGEYPDTLELSQAVIDKEFRTVSNAFRKHIKTQAESQLKKAVDNKKAQTAKRAQVAAKKGLSGSTTQRQILESLKSGNLSGALDAWNQSR